MDLRRGRRRELVVLVAQAITARALLGRDADVAVQVLFFGARLELDERRLTRGRVIAIALAAPVAALGVLLLGASLLAAVAPGVARNALWALTLAALLVVVLQLAPVVIESRDGGLWRSASRVILEELGLMRPALSPIETPARVEPEAGAPVEVAPAPCATAWAPARSSRSRSLVPPGPPPPLWFGREEDPPSR